MATAYPDLTNSTLDPQLVSILKQMATDITNLQQCIDPKYGATRAEIDHSSGIRAFNFNWGEFIDGYMGGSDGSILSVQLPEESFQLGIHPSSAKLMYRMNDNSFGASSYASGWSSWYEVTSTKLSL